MYKSDSNMEGYRERVYLEPEALPALSSASDDDTDTAEESSTKYDSKHDVEVDMCMEDDVDTPDGVDLDCSVDIEMDVCK